MKTYELHLHWKQGDDFRSCLERTKTVSEALRLWADDHKRRQEICLQLARKLEGRRVSADAGTHVISLLAEDEAAKKVLEALAKEELIEIVDVDEGEDDEENGEEDEDDAATEEEEEENEDV